MCSLISRIMRAWGQMSYGKQPSIAKWQSGGLFGRGWQVEREIKRIDIFD